MHHGCVEEMYDRLLPHMNEVDKQEINDLNAEHRPEYEDTFAALEEEATREKELDISDNEEQNDDSNEISTKISYEVPRETVQEETRESLSKASQPSIEEEKLQSLIEEEKLQPPIEEEKFTSGKEQNIKRPKKYACRRRRALARNMWQKINVCIKSFFSWFKLNFECEI